MKVVLPGGSGQVGQILARHFIARGEDVVVLSRGGALAAGRAVAWDGRALGGWQKEIDGESDGLIGGGEPGAPAYWAYSVRIAKEWEAAQTGANTPATRQVALRTSMVMSPDKGGIFDVLLRLVRRGLGGSAGDGKQHVSWITDVDFVRAVDFLVDRGDLRGPVNVAAPAPLPNREFMRDLREAAGVTIGLPAAKWMLEVGAVAMKTDTELLLKSRRVVPGRRLDAGFSFEFAQMGRGCTSSRPPARRAWCGVTAATTSPARKEP